MSQAKPRPLSLQGRGEGEGGAARPATALLRVALLGILVAAVLSASLLPASSSLLPGNDHKFILVVVDGVLWPDYLAAGRTLRDLARTGSLGLMNVRAVPPVSPEAAYLTIGAGSRAAAPPQAVALQVGEPYQNTTAAAAFESRTGAIAPNGGAVYLGIGAAIRVNSSRERHYICRPGLLGSALAGAGITVACIGNADLAAQPRREIVTLAMDEEGMVPLAVVDSRVSRFAPAFAPGMETDSDALLQAFDRVAAKAQFIAVETGDTARLAAVEPDLLPALVAQERRRILLRVDRFLDGLVRRAAGKPWQILIISPTPHPDPNHAAEAMTPIILTGWQAGPGLLTSASTRTPGVVTNTDLAPTILRFFGIQPPADAFGRPVTVVPRTPGAALSSVLSLDSAINAADRSRPIVLNALAALTTIILCVAALALLLNDRAPRSLAAVLRGLSLAIIASPLALLLMGLRVPRGMPGAALGALALTIILALIASFSRRGWVWISLVTSALVVLDLFFGQGMLQRSLLGYSPSVGSRYYGLGNEYGGVLLASVTLGVLALFRAETPRRWQRLSVGLVFLAAAVATGHPAAGANLGMAAACAIGFGAALALMAPGGVSSRRVIAVVVAAILIVGIIVGADLLRGGGASHIGRAVASVRAGGWEALGDIVARRTTRNWTLTQRSAWSGPTIAGLAVLAVALLAAPRRVRGGLAGRRALLAAFGGLAVGAVAAYVLNDSGIVAAALAVSYAAAALTYISFCEPV